MIGLQIREARRGDREIIEAVTLAAYQEYAALMQAHWEIYRQNIVATLADIRPAAQLVADLDGQLVGTVLLYPAGTIVANPGNEPITLTWPEVRLLAVAPAARGQGVGAALMQECIRRVRQSGARVLTLHTSDIMQSAMRLYTRLGFQRAPELDFQPAPEVTVKGFSLSLEEAVS